MSISGASDQDRLYKKSTRKDSGELDVFEATMYFFGGTQVGNLDSIGAPSNFLAPKTTIREELRQQQPKSQRRMSLDINLKTNINPPSINSHRVVVEKQIKEKKYKQPMSPSGRLASFLNSLFNNKSSKKKKKSKSVKDDHEVVVDHSNERIVRRSSVSHFGSLWTSDSKSINSSSSSGYRTPPHAHAKNPRPRDHKVQISTSNLVSENNETMGLEDQKSKNMDLFWLDEKLKLIEELSEKKTSCNGLLKKDKIWVDDNDEDEDGGESDSSSDLFELQNYDLGLYSCGLPVYETTHIESIKRGPPISNGPS